MIEIFRAFLPDGVDVVSGFLGQRFAAAIGPVGETALIGKLIKVSFLDLNLGADFPPAPSTGQIQARQDPSLDLFPSVGGQRHGCGAAPQFQLVESVTPPYLAIAIDA